MRRNLIIGGVVALWTGLTVGVTLWAVRGDSAPTVPAEMRRADVVVPVAPTPEATPGLGPGGSIPIAYGARSAGGADLIVLGSTVAPSAPTRASAATKSKERLSTPPRPSPTPSRPVSSPVTAGSPAARVLTALAAEAASDVGARRELLGRARAAMDALPADRKAAVEDAYERATLRGADRAVYAALAQALLDADRP